MISSVAGLLVLSALVTAHGEQSQSQLAGPHQGLWYNTLPGDGGTQVSTLLSQVDSQFKKTHLTKQKGRLRILRNLDFRPPTLPPMPGQ